MKPIPRLDRAGLVALVKSMWTVGTTSEDEDDWNLVAFAANCPDSPAALDLLLEPEFKNLSADELVDKALAMPKRPVTEYSPKELHPNDALRHVRFIGE